MSAHLLKRLPSWFRLTLLIPLCLCGSSVTGQFLDRNANGMSDIWELLYNRPGAALTVTPHVDSDGDGVPNRLEAVAGTDPNDATSVPRIGRITKTSRGVVVTMTGALGKSYQLLGSEIEGGLATNWV